MGGDREGVRACGRAGRVTRGGSLLIVQGITHGRSR